MIEVCNYMEADSFLPQKFSTLSENIHMSVARVGVVIFKK